MGGGVLHQGLGDAAGPQQAQRRFSRAEPPGSVESGTEAESEGRLVDRLIDTHTRVLEEGTNTGAPPLADHLQAMTDQDPVLVDQRDHVTDGA